MLRRLQRPAGLIIATLQSGIAELAGVSLTL
jgi:hypothetical protein